MAQDKRMSFESAASGPRDGSLWLELCGLVKHNKKWWLVPVLVAVLMLGMLIFLSSTAAAPFIYTLF